MNRQLVYRPLLDRNLLHFQLQHLARRYDFSPQSRVARLLVETVNDRMTEAETALGVRRIPPWTLFLHTRRGPVLLPLLRPEYVELLLAGDDFSDARRLVRQRCLKALREVDANATERDLLTYIDPWALVRRKGPDTYANSLEMQVDLTRGQADWHTWIASLQPVDPFQHLTTLDLCAPGELLQQLTEFAVREAGMGRLVAEQFVQETIALRNACCLRPGQLQSGQMLVLATHVSAHPGLEMAARFRRQTPVILSVLTPEDRLPPQGQTVREHLQQLKRRIVRVCFEAYRQNGLLSLMDLQWVFQLTAPRIGELLRSVQREQNIVVPTPGTVLDAGRSLTHKDIIIHLHWQGHSVREIARMTFHSPRAVDNYIGTFEAVLALKLYGLPPSLMARVLRKGITLVEEYLKLIDQLCIDEDAMRRYLNGKGVNF